MAFFVTDCLATDPLVFLKVNRMHKAEDFGVYHCSVLFV